MKTKLFALIATFTFPMFAAMPAQANDQIAASLCSYIAANDKNSLRKTLSDSKIRIKNVYDGISCDGLPMVRFAIKHNATETAEFIVKQLPSSHVASSGDIEWAQSNGFATSAVIEKIKARAAS